MERFTLTKKAFCGQTALVGRNFVSNGHWAIRYYCLKNVDYSNIDDFLKKHKIQERLFGEHREKTFNMVLREYIYSDSQLAFTTTPFVKTSWLIQPERDLLRLYYGADGSHVWFDEEYLQWFRLPSILYSPLVSGRLTAFMDAPEYENADYVIMPVAIREDRLAWKQLVGHEVRSKSFHEAPKQKTGRMLDLSED